MDIAKHKSVTKIYVRMGCQMPPNYSLNIFPLFSKKLHEHIELITLTVWVYKQKTYDLNLRAIWLTSTTMLQNGLTLFKLD